jgi:hypothetical protein
MNWFLKSRTLKIIYAIFGVAIVLSVSERHVRSFTQDKDAELQLVTRVLEQRYCSDSAAEDQFNVKMQLELQYRNAGKKPIIFAKDGDVILGYKSAPTIKDIEALSFREITAIRRRSGVSEDGDKPSSDFVTLRPNQTFLVETYFTLPYSSDWVLKENQILQIAVSTWPGTKKQSDDLKDKWKSIGLLWTDDVRSQPMQFAIEQDPQIEECSSTAK